MHILIRCHSVIFRSNCGFRFFPLHNRLYPVGCNVADLRGKRTVSVHLIQYCQISAVHDHSLTVSGCYSICKFSEAVILCGRNLTSGLKIDLFQSSICIHAE